jgi:hypothetical protein
MNATDTVKSFLRCWSANHFDGADMLLQRTWIERNPGWLAWMQRIFQYRILTKWEIIKQSRIGDACIDVHVQVTINGKKSQIKIRVLCETAAYKPDINGQWGINPISILKGM